MAPVLFLDFPALECNSTQPVDRGTHSECDPIAGKGPEDVWEAVVDDLKVPGLSAVSGRIAAVGVHPASEGASCQVGHQFHVQLSAAFSSSCLWSSRLRITSQGTGCIDLSIVQAPHARDGLMEEGVH